jgi:pyruvate dehydrogenase E1 component
VLLVKTVKGYGMGKAGEGKNTAHQTKKLTDDDIRYFRDRFNIPIPDSELPKIPFYKPADDTPEMRYLHERRKALGGYLPKRRVKADESFTVPPLETFKAVLDPTAEGREISTTQAYVRFLTQLLRDKALGPRVVPILVDEARTFGMEGLFRQIGIYNPEGQKYTPVDKDQVMYYREDKERPDPAGRHQRSRRHEQLDRRGHVVLDEQPHHGAVLHLLLDVRLPAHRRPGLGGGRHAGARLPAGRHQRAHHAQRRRPAARGRPQPHPGRHHPQLHQLRPDLAHEVGVIIHHGLKRMVEKQDNVFYYLTLLNENYPMPGLKPGTEEQIIKGMYLLEEGARRRRASTCWAAAPSCAKPWRPGSCWKPTGAWPPTCGAAPASTNWRATARTASAGTCCTPRPSACALRGRSSWRRTPARWWRPPTT